MIENTYIGRLLVSLNQLGNTIAGGNPDVTISARLHHVNSTKIGAILEMLVDLVFLPVDGFDHCKKAYERASDERMRRGSDVGLFLVAMFALLFAPIIYPVNVLIFFYREIS